VVLQHLVEIQGPTGSWIVGLLSPGVFGVVLFFIVSGFVIPMSAQRHFNLPDFVIRRIFRIYPLVLAIFLLVAILAIGLQDEAFAYAAHLPARDWIANLLLVQDYVRAQPIWGVTWTLSIEVAWYALFAAALLLLGPRADDRLVLLAPALMVGVCLASLAIDQRIPLARPNLVYAAILGCRFFRLVTGELEGRRVAIDLAVFLAVATLCNMVSFGYFQHPNITANQAVFPWIAAALLFGAVAGLQRIRTSRWVLAPLLGWLGTISYSTYLLHPLAIILAPRLVPAALEVPMALMLTLLLSVAGYRLVEVPGQALGRRIIAARRSHSLRDASA
jgi:peptidoglycan/LPS O-acetylase OafA/YrhL